MENGTGGNFFRSRPKKYGTGTNMKRNRWIIGCVAVLLSVLGMEKGWAIDVDSAEKLRTAIGSGNCTINEGIVYLSKDVEALNTIVVKDGNLILDLNGCNYYNKWGKWFNQYEIDIFDIEGGSLTIKGNGSLYNQGTSSNPTIGVTNGVLNVEATIYSEEHNAITLTGNGTVNVREGAHIYSKQSNKIALRVAAGNVTLTGGKIENQAGGTSISAYKNISEFLPDGYGIYKNNQLQNAEVTSMSGTLEVKLIPYQIRYEENGGPEQSDITYNVTSDDITLPTPERDGFKFMGWYTTDDFSGEAVTTIPKGSTGNKTFYAKWSKIYTITYHVNEGTMPDSYEKTYLQEDKVILPVPSRSGYVFDGWYLTEDFTGEKQIEIPLGTTGDKIFFAKWIAIRYKLSFDSKGGTLIKPITYTKDELTSLPTDLTREHYTFAGWYLNETYTGEALKEVPFPASEGDQTQVDVTVYAKWTPVEYTITFDTNGGRPLESKKYNIEAETFKLPTRSTKTGYTFVGWYKDEALTKPFGTEVPRGTTGDFTLYAKWELTQYKIEYDTYHGTNPADAPVTYTIEDEVVLPVPTRPAFTFAGWHLSELLDDEPQTYIEKGTTGNKTFYAEWSAGNVLKIIRPEGGTITVKAGTTELQSGDRVGVGTTLTVTATPASSDYAFSELIINGTSYTTVPQTVQMPVDGGLTVSARFADLRPAATFSIYFDLPAGVTATNPAGGEVVEAVTSGETLEFRLSVDAAYFESVDAMQVLANGTPIEADADGIYRLEDCTSDVIVSVTGLVGATHEIVLLPSLNGVVAFDGDDGTETSRTVSHGEVVSIVALPDAGYRFEAWADGETTNPRTFTALSDQSFEARFVEETTAYSIILPELAGVTVRPLTGYSTEVKPGGKFKFYLRMDADYDRSVPVVYANEEELEVNQEVYSLYNISENIRISVDGIVRNKETLTLQTAVSAVDVETGLEVANQEIQFEAMVLLHAQAPEGKCFSEWNDGVADNPRMVRAADAPQMFPLFQPSATSDGLKVNLPVLAGAALTPVDANADAVLKDDSVRLKLVILPAYSQSEVKVWANGKELASALSLRASSETRTLFYTLPAMTADVTVEVTGLERNEYDVLVQQQEGGTVSASQTGKVKHGTVITLQATPQAGNMFMKWQDGNTLNPYPYVVTGDCTLSGRFIVTDKPVGNERIPASSVSIQCLNHTLYLYLSEAAPLWIWNVEGKLVKNVLAPSGHSTYPLPDGVYVVRVGTQSPVKVVVR